MTPAARIDIRAHACPITYVKTRIALERLRAGELLEVILCEGEPLDNVPRSAAEEGHLVERVEPAPGQGPGTWRLLLRKGEPREEAP